jgi:hypothetical protein
MGAVFEKFADKLPDLYFDWYARLLPGIVAAGATLYYLPIETQKAALRHTPQLLLMAYAAGHCVQPFSSLFVKRMEDRSPKSEQSYAKHKMEEKRAEGPLAKISKAHAEAVSMMSTALMLVAIYFWFWHLKPPAFHAKLLWAALYFFIAAGIRVVARFRKITHLGP